MRSNQPSRTRNQDHTGQYQLNQHGNPQGNISTQNPPTNSKNNQQNNNPAQKKSQPQTNPPNTRQSIPTTTNNTLQIPNPNMNLSYQIPNRENQTRSFGYQTPSHSTRSSAQMVPKPSQTPVRSGEYGQQSQGAQGRAQRGRGGQIVADRRGNQGQLNQSGHFQQNLPHNFQSNKNGANFQQPSQHFYPSHSQDPNYTSQMSINPIGYDMNYGPVNMNQVPMSQIPSSLGQNEQFSQISQIFDEFSYKIGQASHNSADLLHPSSYPNVQSQQTRMQYLVKKEIKTEVDDDNDGEGEMGVDVDAEGGKKSGKNMGDNSSRTINIDDVLMPSIEPNKHGRRSRNITQNDDNDATEDVIVEKKGKKGQSDGQHETGKKNSAKNDGKRTPIKSTKKPAKNTKQTEKNSGDESTSNETAEEPEEIISSRAARSSARSKNKEIELQSNKKIDKKKIVEEKPKKDKVGEKIDKIDKIDKIHSKKN